MSHRLYSNWLHTSTEPQYVKFLMDYACQFLDLLFNGLVEDSSGNPIKAVRFGDWLHRATDLVVHSPMDEVFKDKHMQPMSFQHTWVRLGTTSATIEIEVFASKIKIATTRMTLVNVLDGTNRVAKIEGETKTHIENNLFASQMIDALFDARPSRTYPSNYGPYPVPASICDGNGHVNNAEYSSIALNARYERLSNGDPKMAEKLLFETRASQDVYAMRCEFNDSLLPSDVYVVETKLGDGVEEYLIKRRDDSNSQRPCSRVLIRSRRTVSKL